MSAIYLMLIILTLSWLVITYQITNEDNDFDAVSKVFYCVLTTICIATLSFAVIIFGPSKLV